MTSRKKEKKKIVDSQNDTYFYSLATSRISPMQLRVSWAGLFFSIIIFIPTHYITLNVDKLHPLQSPFYLFVLLVCVSQLLTFIISFFPKFLYKHQFFTSSLMCLMITTLYTSIMLMMLGVTTFTDDNLNLSSLNSNIYIVIMALSWLLCIIYNVFWMRGQLNKGFSVERTMGNFLASTSVYNTRSLGIIFGVVLLGGGGAFLFLGGLKIVFGYFGGFLMTGAFSRLIVEAAYVAYLKYKNKEFWEPMPKFEKQVPVSQWINWKSAKLRLLVELIIALLIGHFFDVDKLSLEWVILIRVILWLIILDYFISFVMWIFKKWKGREKEK